MPEERVHGELKDSDMVLFLTSVVLLVLLLIEFSVLPLFPYGCKHP